MLDMSADEKIKDKKGKDKIFYRITVLCNYSVICKLKDLH